MNTNKVSSHFSLEANRSVNEIILSKANPAITSLARANLKILKNPEGTDKFILSAKSEVDNSFGGLVRKTLFIARKTNPKKTVPIINTWCDSTFSRTITLAVNNLATFIKDLTPESIKTYEKEILSLPK